MCAFHRNDVHPKLPVSANKHPTPRSHFFARIAHLEQNTRNTSLKLIIVLEQSPKHNSEKLPACESDVMPSTLRSILTTSTPGTSDAPSRCARRRARATSQVVGTISPCPRSEAYSSPSCRKSYTNSSRLRTTRSAHTRRQDGSLRASPASSVNGVRAQRTSRCLISATNWECCWPKSRNKKSYSHRIWKTAEAC